jgi:hypothetical protein
MSEQEMPAGTLHHSKLTLAERLGGRVQVLLHVSHNAERDVMEALIPELEQAVLTVLKDQAWKVIR